MNVQKITVERIARTMWHWSVTDEIGVVWSGVRFTRRAAIRSARSHGRKLERRAQWESEREEIHP